MRMADYRFCMFVLCFWGLLAVPARSQEKAKLDSLNGVLNGANHDTARISALIELSRVYTGIDDDRAFALAKAAVQKSEEIHSEKWTGYALNRLGTVYDVKGKPDSATICLLRALKTFEQLNHSSGKAMVYQNIGVMYYYQKDFDKAFENYRKALSLRMRTKEFFYVAQLYNNMGSVMRRKKEYDSAIAYYTRALDIKQKSGDKQSLASSYINISVAYQYKQDFEKAIDYVNKAIELCRETANDYDLASCYITLGEIFLKTKRAKAARDQALRGLALAEKLKSNELLYNAYEELALCDTLAGDFKAAFSDYVNAAYYKDELYSKQKAEAVSKLQTLYETEKKDTEIKLLNVDNETKRKQQKYLLAILFLSIVLLIIAVWAFAGKQRDNKLLRKQKAEIENKTEQLKEQAAQIARLSSQMNPHFLFNALNSLQKFVLNKETEATLEYINNLSRLMRLTLNNSSAEYISLEEEMKYLRLYLDFEKQLVGETLRAEITAENIDISSAMLPPMLVQPLVENAVKHGLALKEGSKTVKVTFTGRETEIKIVVEDNGIGRKTPAVSHQSKALTIIKSRIQTMFEKEHRPAGHDFFIIEDLHNPSGTRVTLRVPRIEAF